MRLYRWLSDFHGSERGIALAIGNFDGFHVGHQAVITTMQEKARSMGLESAVMIFEPQPLEFFGKLGVLKQGAQGRKIPARLFTIRDKLRIFRAAKVDIVFCMSFTRKFAGMSDVEFISMLQSMNVKSVTVGSEFSFGKGGAYSSEDLKRCCESVGVECSAIDKVEENGVRVSSTLIRSLIEQGDFATVQKFIGRPYAIAGRVVHGNAIGRTIGFPTANINLNRLVCPLRGVYAVTVCCKYGVFDGMANVGYRPTIDKPTLNTLLEVNIFNFDGDLYGSEIEVSFRYKLRDEVKFDSIAQLVAQIKSDKERASYVLSLQQP